MAATTSSSSTAESTVNSDIRALTYLTHVDDNLCCPICHSPLVDPRTTKCRHTFCSDCIADALKVSPTCPVDRYPLKPDEVAMAPVVVANLVNDLTVLCPNQNVGCTSTLPRSLVAGHLRNYCQFAKVDCPGCPQKILRRDLREDCVHVEVGCPHCHDCVKRVDMKEHESRCPQLSSVCHYCSEAFPRSYIINHELACDEAIVPCRSSDIGCTWNGRQKEATDHTQSCPFTYLKPILQDQAMRIAALEQDNKALRRKVEVSLSARASLERNDSDLSTTLESQTTQILTEQERLRADMERLFATMGEMDLNQSMLHMHMSENMRTKEEVAMIGAAVNNLRTQLHSLQLLTLRRQSSLEQRGGGGGGGGGGGANGTTSTTTVAAVNRAVENVSNVLAGRRLSDTTLGDRVRL